MHVLLIAHGLPPSSVGGVEQHTAGLAGALVEAGHEVTLLTRVDLPDRAPFSVQTVHRPAGSTHTHTVIEVQYAFHDVERLDDIYENHKLTEAVVAAVAAMPKRPDLAHIHHLTGLGTGTVAGLKGLGLPVALTLHDYWMMCPRGQMWSHRGDMCPDVSLQRCRPCLHSTFPQWWPDGDNSAREQVERIHRRAADVARTADVLITPSAAARSPWKSVGITPDRIRVVENAVDTRGLDQVPPVPSAAERHGKPLQVGYLGTVIPSKGLDVLVDAVRAQENTPIALHIHGNTVPYHGDQGFPLRVFGNLGSRDRIHYHGPYDARQLPAILGRLHLVAVPALWAETFGLTAREALAAGRPVLVSDIGGLADAVRDQVDGMVLPPGDRPGWSAALAALAAEPERLDRMATAAREGDNRPRGFAAMARELCRIYGDLLTSS